MAVRLDEFWIFKPPKAQGSTKLSGALGVNVLFYKRGITSMQQRWNRGRPSNPRTRGRPTCEVHCHGGSSGFGTRRRSVLWAGPLTASLGHSPPLWVSCSSFIKRGQRSLRCFFREVVAEMRWIVGCVTPGVLKAGVFENTHHPDSFWLLTLL